MYQRGLQNWCISHENGIFKLQNVFSSTHSLSEQKKDFTCPEPGKDSRILQMAMIKS